MLRAVSAFQESPPSTRLVRAPWIRYARVGMGYRDEGEAALHRVQRLDDEKRELEARLAQANAEIVRLQRGGPGATPPLLSTTRKVLFGISLGVAILTLGFFAFAAYRSETKGIQAALFTFPLWGALVGAWRARHRPAPNVFIGSFAWGVLTFFALIFFLATLWRSL